MEVQKLIKYYHASIHDVIDAGVAIDPDDDNVIVCNDYPRYPIKANNDSYYGFGIDVGLDESFDSTNTETESEMYDEYKRAELQIPDNDEMKRMARFL